MCFTSKYERTVQDAGQWHWQIVIFNRKETAALNIAINFIDGCCTVNVPLPLTDTVQLPVNGPCKSRYLAINVICTTVLSLNIQLYNCIAVFSRLHPNTTYLPNTDDTDYTDNRVVFIIWTDNVNAISTTTISSSIQLWYCIAVFPRLYPPNTYLPNTDYTDYTAYRVVFNHMDRYRSITR